MKYALLWVAGIIIVIGLGWVLLENSYRQQAHYAPKFEEVRRETREQSHAYRQGQIQQIQNMQAEYITSAPVQRAGLATLLLQRVADVPDPTTLPETTRDFVACVRASAPAYERSCQPT